MLLLEAISRRWLVAVWVVGASACFEFGVPRHEGDAGGAGGSGGVSGSGGSGGVSGSGGSGGVSGSGGSGGVSGSGGSGGVSGSGGSGGVSGSGGSGGVSGSGGSGGVSGSGGSGGVSGSGGSGGVSGSGGSGGVSGSGGSGGVSGSGGSGGVSGSGGSGGVSGSGGSGGVSGSGGSGGASGSGGSGGVSGSGGSGGVSGSGGSGGVGGTGGAGGAVCGLGGGGTGGTPTANPASGPLSYDETVFVSFNTAFELSTLQVRGSLADAPHTVLCGGTPSFISIAPQSRWYAGAGQSLIIDVDDPSGVPLPTLTLTYAVEGMTAFVTSVTGNGDLSSWADADGNTGLAAADAVCNARAALGGLPGGYAAWLSSSTDDAYCRLSGFDGLKADNCAQTALPVDAGPWARVDGARFAGTIAELANGPDVIFNPLLLDEFGQQIPPPLSHWAGTTRLGTGVLMPNCLDWSAPSGSTGYTGYSDACTAHWTSELAHACDVGRRLACFQVGVGGALRPPSGVGKRVFITGGQGTGDLSSWANAGANTGINAGDAICQAEATAAGLQNPGNFKVWLSDNNEAAFDRILGTGPWIRPDGERVFETRSDLLLVPPTCINQRANGQYFLANFWSSTRLDGTLFGDHCIDWANPSAAIDGGRAINNRPAAWGQISASACSTTFFSLVCLED